jgi:hypothetical protein
MRVPKSEIPDVEQIRSWAQETLPERYTLREVRCVPGLEMRDAILEDFSVIIEYVDQTDEDLAGTAEEIQRYQEWSQPLIDKIRLDWPAPTVAIMFNQRAAVRE